MTAAPMPASAFWAPEIWFEPRIRGCLRADTSTVLYVVLQNRRALPLVDVVLDLFHVELRDGDSQGHIRASRFDVGLMEARTTIDLVRTLEPAADATDVHEVVVLGRLRGRDAESGEDVIEPVSFRCDGDDDIYLHPAPVHLAIDHPEWATAAGKSAHQREE